MFKKNELVAEIIRKGYKIEDFAKIVGLNPATLYRKMNGKTDFYRNEIVKIAEILDLSNRAICNIFFGK